MASKRSISLALVALFCAPSMASADLIGVTVNQEFYFADANTPYCDNGSAVVGGSVEFGSGCDGFAPVATDIHDSYLTVDTSGLGWRPAEFNGFVLTVLDGPRFTSATDGGGAMAVTSLTIEDGRLWLNFAGQEGGGMATVDFVVPEPGTLALLGIGLFGIGLARRRKL